MYSYLKKYFNIDVYKSVIESAIRIINTDNVCIVDVESTKENIKGEDIHVLYVKGRDRSENLICQERYILCPGSALSTEFSEKVMEIFLDFVVSAVYNLNIGFGVIESLTDSFDKVAEGFIRDGLMSEDGKFLKSELRAKLSKLEGKSGSKPQAENPLASMLSGLDGLDDLDNLDNLDDQDDVDSLNSFNNLDLGGLESLDKLDGSDNDDSINIDIRDLLD
jgi:hypothetical protein